MDNSKRHHYLPEFYIKGFTDDKGFIWIYDKSLNIILKKQKAPKGIFFEWNLNSFNLEGQSIDILEKAFSYIDSLIANKFIDIRDAPDIDSIENIAHIATLTKFITQLFWRTPSTSHIHDKLIEHYNIHKAQWRAFYSQRNIDFLSQEDQAKMLKAMIPFEILMDVENTEAESNPMLSKILSYKSPIFILSDNPTLFKKVPTNRAEFSGSLIFPISKNRIFLGLEKPNYFIGLEQLKLINLLLMYQAKRYVACGSRELLEQCIKGYQHVMKISKDDIQSIYDELFYHINID